MTTIYDNRMQGASGNTISALDAICAAAQYAAMDNTQQIRDALKAKLDAKAVTQTEIGKVIGIAQPNVVTLFIPGKNGKLRDISFDEGMDLIRTFELADLPASQEPTRINENTLARLLHSLGPSLPKSGLSESAAQALAVALTHGLELLSETGANEPTDREIAMAARAAMSRFREASRQ